MSEGGEGDKPTAVTTIRENIKKNIRIARLKHRQDELDNLRITDGNLEDHSINLQTFTTADILAIVHRMKKQKYASPMDLMKLSHAFLQSTDNINCFINATGAIAVIVKEMTGMQTEKQMLAIECMCNLSLGPKKVCEQIAQKCGTYFHTYLQNSNESLVRTSLWCLTNLIVAGDKPLNILLKQELIAAIVNVTHSIHSKHLKDETYTAIELILDHGGVPTPSDVEILSKWILRQKAPFGLGTTKIVYKLLGLVSYQSNDAIAVQKLAHICFETLIYLHDSTLAVSVESIEFLHHIVLLMRICSNIVALENSFTNYIIETWFAAQSRSLLSFFNRLIELFTIHNLAIDEIYWFIGNLMKCQLSEASLKHIEMSAFFVNI